MNKKRFYIITTCCIIAIFVIFEIAVYCLVGEDELIKNEKMRALWMLPEYSMCPGQEILRKQALLLREHCGF